MQLFPSVTAFLQDSFPKQVFGVSLSSPLTSTNFDKLLSISLYNLNLLLQPHKCHSVLLYFFKIQALLCRIGWPQTFILPSSTPD